MLAIAKLIALHANAKNNKRSNYFLMFDISNWRVVVSVKKGVFIPRYR